jgi:hypothetical protein
VSFVCRGSDSRRRLRDPEHSSIFRRLDRIANEPQEPYGSSFSVSRQPPGVGISVGSAPEALRISIRTSIRKIQRSSRASFTVSVRAPPDRSIATARNGEREPGREYCARARDRPVEHDPAAEAQNDPAKSVRNGPPKEVSSMGRVVIVAELPLPRRPSRSSIDLDLVQLALEPADLGEPELAIVEIRGGTMGDALVLRNSRPRELTLAVRDLASRRRAVRLQCCSKLRQTFGEHARGVSDEYGHSRPDSRPRPAGPSAGGPRPSGPSDLRARRAHGVARGPRHIDAEQPLQQACSPDPAERAGPQGRDDGRDGQIGL